MTKKQAANAIIAEGGGCETVECEDCFLGFDNPELCKSGGYHADSAVLKAAKEFLKSGNVYASGYQPTRPPAGYVSTPPQNPSGDLNKWAGLANEGRKDDDNKTRMELLPFNALVKVADVLTYGAEKYGAHNWQGVSSERYVGALLRHLAAYMDGEDVDPESGRSHLAHLATNALFLLSKYKTAKKAEAYKQEIREKMSK